MVSVSCGACGASAADGSRFCASCGQPLVARADERRVVTVLFADLVGFTTMAEARDPEQVKNLVDRCFERLAADIADFGGRVDKVVGDAILALFGAPVAHEDDAERAVRAGLRMQETLADVGRRGRASAGCGCGSASTPARCSSAACGPAATGRRWATSSTPPAACRPWPSPAPSWSGPRPTRPPPGSSATRPLGALAAKGRVAPVEAWVAEEAVAPPGRRTRRLDVPLVGRDEERTILDSLVGRGRAPPPRRHRRRGRRGRHGQDPPRRGGRRPRRGGLRRGGARGRVRPLRRGQRLVAGRRRPAQRASERRWAPSAENARRACIDRVRLALPDAAEAEIERVAEGLLHLLGEPSALEGIDPSRAREEVTRSLVTYVEGWARPAARDRGAVRPALGRRRRARARRRAGRARRATCPSCCSPRPGPACWSGGTRRSARSNHVVLHLDPLDRDAASELLDHLVCDVPDELRELVLDRSGGNPFFLEELASLLGEGGGRTGVPHTLRGLVAARLDTLLAARAGGDRRRRHPRSALPRHGDPPHGREGLGHVGHGDRPGAGRARRQGPARRRRRLLHVPLRPRAGGRLRHAHQGGPHQGPLRRGQLDRAAPLRQRRRPRSGGPPLRHRRHAGQRAGHRRRRPRRPRPAGRRRARARRSRPPRPTSSTSWCAGWPPRRSSSPTPVRPRRAHPGRLPAGPGQGGVRPARPRRGRASTSTDAQLAAERAGDPLLLADVHAVQGELEQKRGDLDAAVALLSEAVEVFRSAGELRRMAEALLPLGQTHIFAGNDDAAGVALRRGARRLPVPRRPPGRGLGACRAWPGWPTPPGASARPTPAARSRSPSSRSWATEVGSRGPSACTPTCATTRPGSTRPRRWPIASSTTPRSGPIRGPWA